MYTVGVICRYFDVDEVIRRYRDNDAVAKIRNSLLEDPTTETSEGMVRRQVLDIFGAYCSAASHHLKLISLSALGQVTVCSLSS